MIQLLRRLSSDELQELVDLVAGCSCSNVKTKADEEVQTEKLVQTDVQDYFDIVIFNFETVNKSIKEYKDTTEEYILQREQEFSEALSELKALQNDRQNDFGAEQKVIDNLNKKISDLAEIIKQKSTVVKQEIPSPPVPPSPGRAPLPRRQPAPPKPGGPSRLPRPTVTSSDIAKVTIGAGLLVTASKERTRSEVIKVANKLGYDEYYTMAILGAMEKESRTNLTREEDIAGYAKTNNKRIRKTFRAARNMSDEEINTLKKDKVAFANKMYGARGGNKGGDDGWNYRGRGLFQITGRDQYRAVGKLIGVDLEKNPDLLFKPDVAVKAAFAFLSLPGGLRKKKATSQAEATREVVQVLAGRGFNLNKDANDNLGKATKFAAAIKKTGIYEKTLKQKNEPNDKVTSGSAKPIANATASPITATSSEIANKAPGKKTQTVVVPIIIQK